LPALPKESYNPGNDSFSKDVDYDFIEDSPKKPARNGKRKPPASPREKAQKSVEGPSPPKQNKLKPAETQKDEGDKNTERSLSPVSQLILEMEQKNAKEIQTAPVARRTRSSLSMPPDGWMDGLDFRWSEQMPPRTPRMTIQSSNANNTSQGAGFT